MTNQPRMEKSTLPDVLTLAVQSTILLAQRQHLWRFIGMGRTAEFDLATLYC